MPSPSDNPLQWAGPENEQFAREFNKCVTADLLRSNWITEDEALHRIAKILPSPSDNYDLLYEALHRIAKITPMPSPSDNYDVLYDRPYPKAPFRPGVGTFFRVGFAAIAFALQSAVNAAALKLRGKAIPKD